MKKLFIFLGCLILSASLFAQQPLVRLYMDDGSVREFHLEDIEQITHISRSNDMIMEVYQQDGVEDVYPAMSVSRLSFTTDSLDTRMFTAHIFDQPRHFAISSIDSIVFSRLEPKVVDNITVVDSLSWADIISVGENTITFRAGSSLASAITIGWFVVSAPIPEAPEGFLRKVTGLSTQGDLLIATTEDGNLFEVIEDGMISFQVSFSEEEMSTIINEAGGNEDKRPDKAISFTYGDEIIPGFKIEGELGLSNTFSYSFIKWKHIIRHYHMQHNITMTYKLTAEATLLEIVSEGGISVNDLLGISPFRLPPQITWIGLVPVVITSYIDLQAAIKLSIFNKVSSHITQTTNTTVGIKYDVFGEEESYVHLSSSSMKPTFSPPTLSLGGTLKVSSGPQINQGFYGMHKMFNAFVGVFAFSELELDFLKKPFWKLYAGIETGAGVESEWLDLKKEFPYSMKRKELLKQSTDLIDKVVPAEAAVGDTIKVLGQGLGSMEKSFVGFKFGPSLLEEDVVKVTKYIKWKDDEIEFVLPPGFVIPPGQNELKVDVLVNSKGFWTDIVPFTVLHGPTIESIDPDTVRIGKPVVIKGKRFGDMRETSEVSFGGILVEEYEAWSDTEITVKVPEGIDHGVLTVEVDERISNEVPYLVAAPFIASIDPNEVFPGDEMVIIGKYFDDLRNESFVSFGGVVATNYLEWSEKKIVLKIPDKIESGVLWLEVAGKESNDKAYVVKEVEVTILPPRIVTYEMLMGAKEVEHDFEAYAKPDSVYRFTWQFDDGNTYSEIVQKGETSKVSHTYVDVKDGDTFYPSVELYDLDGKLLAMDDITINITSKEVEPGPEEITVGNLVWMTKNLDVDVGNNWYPQGKYCKTFRDDGYCEEYYWKEHTEYGRLYDWESAIAACESIGWRLPSIVEWGQLIDHLGGWEVAGGKLKSTRTNSKVRMGNSSHDNPDGHPAWYEPNTGATNESGFSALPGGFRFTDGYFSFLGDIGYWWSSNDASTEASTTFAQGRKMDYRNGHSDPYGMNKANGCSVRCVQDTDTSYTLNLEVSPPEAGSVQGAGDYSAGDEVSIYATANPDWEFVIWTDAMGEVVATTPEHDLVMPANDMTLTANFEEIIPDTFELTLVASPAAGGDVGGGGAFEEDTEVPLTATSNEGWEFVNWTGQDDAEISDQAIFIYTMPADDVTLTANFKEEDIDTEVVGVTNPATGKTWMDRNLGASRVAISITDEQAYGDLYQWGRAADGHHKRTSGTTTTLSSNDTPGHGKFILAPNSPYDWRSSQNDNLWQDISGTNNPCPSGYRLPTEAEWDAERQSWSINNATGAFDSPLKLPAAGLRRGSYGSLYYVGSLGFYWSSNVDGTYSRHLGLSNTVAGMYPYYRAYGRSVRCIKD